MAITNRTRQKGTNPLGGPRPQTTLFLSLSVDGRITSHDSDDFDPDKSWKQTPGVRGLLQQFYEFNEPDMTALTIGSYMAKVGVNTRQAVPKKESVSLVVLDPDADLNPSGISYLASNLQKLFYVCLDSQPTTMNKAKPSANLSLISYPQEIDLNDLFTKLHQDHHIKSLAIHSIAPLNADLLDAGLIDHLSVIISPLLVGGHGTPALQDSDIFSIRTLRLVSSQVFSNNFINLRYDVLNV